MRTGGAEALAFDVACLSGPEAALPHGSPGDRPVHRRRGPAVRLRCPGRRLSQRHDPDAVRRRARPSATSTIYELVARAQAAAIERARGAVARRRRPRAPAERPRDRRGRARRHRRPPATATTSGTAPGHGIGLATHEAPSLGRLARGRRRCRARRSSPSSPGVYLEGETGVRIEDLVAARRRSRTGRAADAVPARGDRRRRRLSGGSRSLCYDRARSTPHRPRRSRVPIAGPDRPSRPGARTHDQHR